MSDGVATAVSHPNIAFIKYWGNRDERIRLPANGSLSMTLGGLHTRTSVRFDAALQADEVSLNGAPASPGSVQRVAAHLDHIRSLSGVAEYAAVSSESDFPTGAGLASSASAFASLTLAACAAAAYAVDPQVASRIARRGSGSACRSLFGGFVEGLTGDADKDGYAQQLAPPEHWDLVDWIVVFDQQPKEVGSSDGHRRATTSPLQAARVADTPRRLDLCRRAIQERDFDALAEVVELDSHLMHAVMLTSQPPLMYWQPETLDLLRTVRGWRADGLRACCTVDAGPNVHCLSPADAADELHRALQQHCPQARLIRGIPGQAACLVEA